MHAAGTITGRMPAPLADLIAGLREHPQPGFPGRVVVPPGLRALYLALLDRPVLAVVPGEREAEELADDLALFTGAAHLPAWETLPFEHVSPNVTTMAARARARHLLGRSHVVASVRAAVQRSSPSPVEPVVVERGGRVDLVDLVAALVEAGYQRTERVEARGEMAVRGGIVDVYPAQGEIPVRLDFWGDTVEEMRGFSVATQRSVEAVHRLVAYPAREVRPDATMRARARELALAEPWGASTWVRLAEGAVFGGMESWLPWLAPDLSALGAGTPVVVFDPVRSAARAEELAGEEAELAAALAGTWGKGAADHPPLYLPLDIPADALECPPLPAGPGEEGWRVAGLDATPGDPESVAAALGSLLGRGMRVVVAMDGPAAADRVARVLDEHGLHLPRHPGGPESAVIETGIHRGFIAPDLGLAVLGEQEIAGRRRAHRRPGHRGGAGPATPYGDLNPGDYVVHRHHGIGRFEGMVNRTVAGVERDYLLVAYQGADRLYVPTDQLAAVRKYTGGEAPRLSRMGGADWSRTRSRIRREVAAVAEEVVALHRSRLRVAGHRYPADTPWQREMEQGFPFEETPDQMSAVNEVKADMEEPEPMDRLIFGDVGFGKTEVAVRAAFKAVQDGKQVAVLVPTTLLAQQHHLTFSDRFAPFPIRVEMLSRFLTARQQAGVIRDITAGEVDLVVGTHRLLSDDIAFRDLGLLVVDEEQRFGVAAKDRIKALRQSVDVLTLTATPIPRTLEMALIGIRKVSRIATPPEDRHPILTFVGPYEPRTVSAAIRREMLREGQVFYVHNRIETIDHAVARLRDLVPEARYAVAHGRMNEGQLEQVMLDFWNGEYDVLVATTIIESGLDLPQVNTLIVERADLLGLAQLYQLRGRVGRSTQRAYAYLFHPDGAALGESAHRRLEAIGEFGDLGSGFQLAMRDLEIRGAGSILGNVQSGHISAVGFDLYCELVAEAVEELETGRTAGAATPEVRIDLPVDAHLPEAYVADQEARLEAYRRLAGADDHRAVDDVAAEWGDRYGPVPPAAATLIEIARIRVEALRLGIAEVVAMRREVKIAPVTLSQSQEVRLQRLSPRSVVRQGAMFIPTPTRAAASSVLEFLRTMWPPPSQE